MTVDGTLVDRARTGFQRSYGCAPDLIAFAPGRVNLIGEHTDYNEGFVLPCAIPYGTVIAFGRNAAPQIEAVALDLNDARDQFSLEGDIAPLAEGHWANHLRGVTAGMSQFGLPRTGARMAIAGNVPQGAGLSSSASLSVAIGFGLAAIAGQPAPDRTTLARIAQWSEHHFVGCACGIMDQLASAYGKEGHALLIDCRTTTATSICVPDAARVMIVHSGVKRGLVDSAYNERRAQCMAAAHHYGVAALRDLDEDQLLSNHANLDETAFNRARHVVTENARVLAMAETLANADYPAMGDLMAASHISMRDDFEITLPEIDALVSCMADAIGSDGGVRMTGGGFGGCVVALVKESAVDRLERALSFHWAKLGRTSPLQVIVAPSAGAQLI